MQSPYHLQKAFSMSLEVPAPILSGLIPSVPQTIERIRPEEIGSRRQPNVLIVGGSIAGCCSAIALSAIGCRCSILEKRSGELRSQGAGLVIQSDMAAFLNRFGVIEDLLTICVKSSGRQYVARDGTILEKIDKIQLFSAWDVLHHTLRRSIPSNIVFKAGSCVEQVHIDEERDHCVTVTLQNEEVYSGDLLVAADGAGSIIRQKFFPQKSSKYQGYVAWRGLVPECELPAHVKDLIGNRFTIHQGQDWQGHILCYFIPGENGSTDIGNRRLNWVWYQNVEKEGLATVLTDVQGKVHRYSVPRGMIHPNIAQKQREFARQVMPLPLADMVYATQDIFVQAIEDLLVPSHSIAERIALVGDSGAILRPHTAAGTTKAALNAWSLANCLKDANFVVSQALRQYNAAMQPVAEELVNIGISIGNKSQFGE